MEFPKYANITVRKRIRLFLDDSEMEYYQREGFKEEDVKNIIEEDLRERIWQVIHDNDITITID